MESAEDVRPCDHSFICVSEYWLVHDSALLDGKKPTVESGHCDGDS